MYKNHLNSDFLTETTILTKPWETKTSTRILRFYIFPHQPFLPSPLISLYYLVTRNRPTSYCFYQHVHLLWRNPTAQHFISASIPNAHSTASTHSIIPSRASGTKRLNLASNPCPAASSRTYHFGIPLLLPLAASLFREAAFELPDAPQKYTRHD